MVIFTRNLNQSEAYDQEESISQPTSPSHLLPGVNSLCSLISAISQSVSSRSLLKQMAEDMMPLTFHTKILKTIIRKIWVLIAVGTFLQVLDDSEVRSVFVSIWNLNLNF